MTQEQLGLFGSSSKQVEQKETMSSKKDSNQREEVDAKFAGITGELRSKVDTLWLTFYSNGISNPLSVIEQITYLLFMRRLDELEIAKESMANLLGGEIENRIFPEDRQACRWSVFSLESDSEKMLQMVRDAFAFIKDELHATAEGGEENVSAYQEHIKSAVFLIASDAMIKSVVKQISALPEGRDTMGDLYEYMLSKVASAGQNGQFRTPRHIIKMIVEMVKPTAEDFICDPSCGTGGFLLMASEHVRDMMLKGSAEDREHFESTMFTGYDFDSTMLRIGTMNLLLHGISNPTIKNRNSLSDQNPDADAFTLILANPPFKGSVDKDEVSKDLSKPHKTTKSELLFLRLILRMLQIGGRAAVIVPDGVLFGSSKAHEKTRKLIVDEHKLEAVVSMPSGVFKPYAGVSTAILFFTRTDSGGTDDVWFYNMEADGYSLDDKRDPIDANDIPDLMERWNNRDSEADTDRKAKAFFVPLEELQNNKYDLSINRYKEIEYEEVEYEPFETILDKIEALQEKNRKNIQTLRGML